MIETIAIGLLACLFAFSQTAKYCGTKRRAMQFMVAIAWMMPCVICLYVDSLTTINPLWNFGLTSTFYGVLAMASRFGPKYRSSSK